MIGGERNAPAIALRLEVRGLIRQICFLGHDDRALGIGAAGLAIVEALVVSPHIERLHLEGAIRGLGIAGLELDSVHHTAEALAKTELTLLVVILVLHAFRPRAEPG